MCIFLQPLPPPLTMLCAVEVLQIFLYFRKGIPLAPFSVNFAPIRGRLFTGWSSWRRDHAWMRQEQPFTPVGTRIALQTSMWDEHNFLCFMLALSLEPHTGVCVHRRELVIYLNAFTGDATTEFPSTLKMARGGVCVIYIFDIHQLLSKNRFTVFWLDYIWRFWQMQWGLGRQLWP